MWVIKTQTFHYLLEFRWDSGSITLKLIHTHTLKVHIFRAQTSPIDLDSGLFKTLLYATHDYSPALFSKRCVFNQILFWGGVVPLDFLCCQVEIPDNTRYCCAARRRVTWHHFVKGLHTSWEKNKIGTKYEFVYKNNFLIFTWQEIEEHQKVLLASNLNNSNTTYRL